MNPEVFDFKASRGWFEKFSKRSGIHGVVRHGEAANSDKDAAEQFKVIFSNFIKTENYLPQQVLIVMRLGFFGRKCHEGPTSRVKRSRCQVTNL